MTLQSVHEASWSFMQASGTSIAGPNTLHQHFEASQFLECEHISMNSVLCFDWQVWTSAWHWCHVALPWAERTMHLEAYHFHLNFPLQSFNVGCECKINLSACGRYTINCGTPPVETIRINCAVEARCILSVSCSTDLDFAYCFVSVDPVNVFLEHMHRIVKTSEWFMQDFPHHFSLFSLPFGSCIKHHNHCNIHLKIWIDHDPASAKPLEKSRTVVSGLRTKMFENAILEPRSWKLFEY